MAAKGQMHFKNVAVLGFEKHIVGSAGMAERHEIQIREWVPARELALEFLQEVVRLTGYEIAPGL